MFVPTIGQSVDIPCFGCVFHGIVKKVSGSAVYVTFGDGSSGALFCHEIVKHIPKSI